MGKVVKHAVTVNLEEGDKVFLPPYRFEQDAKMASSSLVDLPGVECVKVDEIVIEQ